MRLIDALILEGDAAEKLKVIDAESVHTCVTSPPYFGLRDYGTSGQIGLEQTPEEYVEKLVMVFREVRRTLRDDGTLWLNVGDSYAKNRKRRRVWPQNPERRCVSKQRGLRSL